MGIPKAVQVKRFSQRWQTMQVQLLASLWSDMSSVVMRDVTHKNDI